MLMFSRLTVCRIASWHNVFTNVLCFDDGLRSVVERSVYGTPKPYNFEDRTLLGVEQADKLLTKMYGDYMTPPPAGAEFRHNFYYLDLENPYRNYHGDK